MKKRKDYKRKLKEQPAIREVEQISEGEGKESRVKGKETREKGRTPEGKGKEQD